MNNQRWMSQNFFTFFLTWGIFLPYWTGFLIGVKGVTIAQAGLIMSIGLLARGCSTLFLFPYIAKKWSGKQVLRVLAYSALFTALLYIPAASFTQVLVVTVLFSIVYPALMPAMDSVAGVLVKHKLLDYGKSRSYGSLGFIVMVLVISMVTGTFGDEALLLFLLLGLVLLAALTTMPTPHVLTTKPEITRKSFTMKDLFKTKHFTFVMLIAVLLQGSHATYYNYGYIYLQELEVSKYYIGLIINIGVVFEILFFAKADRIFRNWSPANLLALAAVGTTARWLLVALVPSVTVFIATQMLHAFSFAMTHYAVVLFFTRNLPQQQIANAQGMYSAFALSWSTAVLTLFGGWLYEMEPSYAFFGMVLCSVPAFLLALVLSKKKPATI